MRRLLSVPLLLLLLSPVSVSAQTRTVTADAVRLNTVPCQLTSGTAAPSGGNNCDMYVKSDGTLWVKAGGAWTGISTGSVTMPAIASGETFGIYQGTVNLIRSYKGPTSYGNNIFVGAGAGNSTLDAAGGDTGLGSNNVAIGENALHNATTMDSNIGIGRDSGAFGTTASHNTGVGIYTLASNVTGGFNVAVGTNAMRFSASPNYTTAIGSATLWNVTGDQNTAVGFQAGHSLTSGIGNVFIGFQAGYYEVGEHNNLYIDNSPRANVSDARTKALIYGKFAVDPANQTLTANATLTATGPLVSGAEFYHKLNLSVLNKAENGWVSWAARDAAGVESHVDLSNIGTIVTSGNVGVATTPTTFNLQIAGHTGPDADSTYNLASNAVRWAAGYFDYLTADELHVRAFTADIEQALVGGQIISKTVAVVAAAFTLPAAGAAGTFLVEDVANMAGMDVFVDGDFIRFRQFSRTANSLDVADAWGVISTTGDCADVHAHNGDGTQTWCFVRSSGTDAGTGSGSITRGQLVIDYGVSGNGLIEATVLDTTSQANTPYTRYLNWVTHPRTGQQTQAQIGNLNGSYGYSAATYGFAAGLYANGFSFVTVDPTNGVRMQRRASDTDTTMFQLAADGSGTLASGNISWDTAGVLKAGGWVIGATSLTDVAGVVGMSSAVTGGDDIRFWAGHATPASAPWYVTEAGLMYAVGATFRTATSGGYSILGPAGLSVYSSPGGIRGHFGLLSNLYDYGAGEVNGLAVGDEAGTWLSMDGTNGFRISYATTTIAQVSAAGAATFTGVTVQSAASGARTVLSTDGLKLYSAAANIGIFDGDGVRIQPTDAATGWDAKYMYGWIGTKAGLRFYLHPTSRTNDVLEIMHQGRNAYITFVDSSDGSRVAAWNFHHDPTNDVVALFGENAETQIGQPGTPITDIWADTITLGGTALVSFPGSTMTSGSCTGSDKASSWTVDANGMLDSITCSADPTARELAMLRAMVADLQARLAVLENKR